ncbi:MAG: hypothetical protein ACUVXF_00925 [Desulfobaccales bacterium]
MSEMRRAFCRRGEWGALVVFLGLNFFLVSPLAAGPPGAAGPGSPGPKSSVVILSGEFFQAMEKLAKSETVYGDRQEVFLEQIATAQRFLVKTNLALLEQNEKIIRLLEEISRQRQGEKR